MAGNLKDEIAAANVNFMKCYDSADWDGLSQLYTPDCQLMPTGVQTQTGRDAVKMVFSGVNQAGGKKVILTIDEVGVLDANFDTAFERSQFRFLKEDGSTLDNGKYVVIWKKIDGKWYLHIDIFNSNNS